MVVEHFKEGKARKIYRRAEESGRMLPNGLRYIDSWVSARCFQLMECDDERLLEQWIDHWRDLVEFEVVPVTTSTDAASRVLNSQEKNNFIN